MDHFPAERFNCDTVLQPPFHSGDTLLGMSQRLSQPMVRNIYKCICFTFSCHSSLDRKGDSRLTTIIMEIPSVKKTKVLHYLTILCLSLAFLYQSIAGLRKFLERNTSFHVTLRVSIKESNHVRFSATAFDCRKKN